MLAKRIIAALDIRDGRVVKGIRFERIQDVGDPLTQAMIYEEQGADEIVFLDIAASQENRNHRSELMAQVGRRLRIPFTVGGGITSVREMVQLVQSGADKVFVNTAAVDDPNLIREGALVIGSANLVVAIDARQIGDQWKVMIRGGHSETRWQLLDWCQYVQDAGAGEILLTSMGHDGTKKGYDLAMLTAVTNTVTIPVVASGGAGRIEDFEALFQQTNASGALAASIFHYGTIGIHHLKEELHRRGIHVRMDKNNPMG